MSNRPSSSHSSEFIRNPYVDHTRNSSGTSVALGSSMIPPRTASPQGSSTMVVSEQKRPKRRTPLNTFRARKPDEDENLSFEKGLWSTIDSVTANMEDDYTSAPQFMPHHKLISFLDPTQLTQVEQSLQSLHAFYQETMGHIRTRYIDMDTIVEGLNHAKDKRKGIACEINYSHAIGIGSVDPSVYFGATETENVKDSGMQMIFFLILSRKLEIPPHKRTAYDPLYNVVDLVILASLGIRGLMTGEVRQQEMKRLPRTTVLYTPNVSFIALEEILEAHHTTELAGNFILMTSMNLIRDCAGRAAMKSFGENSLRRIYNFLGSEQLGMRYIAYVPHPEEFHHTPKRAVVDAVQHTRGSINWTLRVQRSKLGEKFRRDIKPHIKSLAGLSVKGRISADPGRPVNGSHIINEGLDKALKQRDPVDLLAERLENIKHRENGQVYVIEPESVSDDNGWGPWRFEDEQGYAPVHNNYEGHVPELTYRSSNLRWF